MAAMNVSSNSLPYRVVPLQDDGKNYQVQKLTNNGKNFFYVQVQNVPTQEDGVAVIRWLTNKLLVKGMS